MSLLFAILGHTVRRAARTEPVFHAALTSWPLPVSQTSLVPPLVAIKVTIEWVIPRDAVPSAACSKPTRITDFSTQLVTGVVSTRVIPRDTLDIASITVEVLVAEHL